MVQRLLSGKRWQRLGAALLLGGAVLLCAVPVFAAKAKTQDTPPEMWEMSLDGGRSLTWERNFNSEAEVKGDRGFWHKVVDVIAGAPTFRTLVRPYSVVSDSRGRILVTDPGAPGVHIFDFTGHRYKFIQRIGKDFSMLTPQCVAVDGEDNIYVTDSDAGVIFEFEPSGKYLRTIGALKGGEGYFKRPTGIAVDSVAQRIYVTDTLRDKVYMLDMQGNIVQTIGKTGEAEGEFNLPTELRLDGPNLMVVDAMNFRVQVFDRAGKFEYAIGAKGGEAGAMFRPKAVSMDSEGDVYVVDAQWGVVQVFNRKGQLLYDFGTEGTHAGEFQLPTGLYIDHDDHVYVVDSFNRRVQMFQYSGLKRAALGEAR